MGPLTPDARPDPCRGWTPEELAALDHTELVAVVQRDLLLAPKGSTADQLEDQVLATQTTGAVRGVICWADLGDGDVVLYDPDRAAQLRQVVDTIEALSSWGDVKQLVERAADDEGSDGFAREVVLNRIGALWEGGWLDDAPGVEEVDPNTITDTHALLRYVPPETPFALDNEEFLLADPSEPEQMGVPLLVERRYYADRANVISTWRSVSLEDLEAVRETLAAIGWRLEQGHLDDLPT